MLHTATDESRRQRWEDGTDWPLTITAVVFLAAYAVPILRPDLVSPWPSICQFVTWAAWALFAVDYTARLALSRDRAGFVRGSLFDLAVVAPPLLRPLRLLRLVTLLSVLNRYAGGSLRGRVAVYVAGATVTTIGRRGHAARRRGVTQAVGRALWTTNHDPTPRAFGGSANSFSTPTTDIHQTRCRLRRRCVYQWWLA